MGSEAHFSPYTISGRQRMSGRVAAYHKGEAGGLARSRGAHARPGRRGRGRGRVAAHDGGGEGTQLGAEVTPLPLHLRHQGLDLPQQQVVLPPRRRRVLLLVAVHARHTGCVQSSLNHDIIVLLPAR